MSRGQGSGIRDQATVWEPGGAADLVPSPGPPLVHRFLSEVLRLAAQLTLSQKLVLAGLLVGTVYALLVLSGSGGPGGYAPLFTNLGSADAGEIVAKLKEQKVTYRLADGGSTILVPGTQVYEMRLHLASQGLPQQGTVGFELFDRPLAGLTDFTQKLNFQRALQGELARTISQMAGVEGARVHLVLPEKPLFSQQEKPARAAVVIKLKAGARLSPAQIRGIVHLVAGSVENLEEPNVTLTDSSGRSLFGPAGAAGGGEEDGAAGGGTDSHRAGPELARDLQSLLDGVLGPGNAIVRVRVETTHERIETNSEQFDPNNVLRSSRTIRDGVPPGGPGRGTPGPPLIPPPAPAATTGTGGREEIVNNYEISRTVQKRTRYPGEIVRLTVAVALNKAISAAQTDELRQMIAVAAGIDPKRGDTLAVTPLAFEPGSLKEDTAALEKEQRWWFYLRLARYAGYGLCALALLLVAWIWRPRLRSPLEPPADREWLVGDGGPLALGSAGDVRLAMPLTDEDRLRFQTSALIRQHPEQAAKALRTWLNN